MEFWAIDLKLRGDFVAVIEIDFYCSDSSRTVGLPRRNDGPLMCCFGLVAGKGLPSTTALLVVVDYAIVLFLRAGCCYCCLVPRCTVLLDCKAETMS